MHCIRCKLTAVYSVDDSCQSQKLHPVADTQCDTRLCRLLVTRCVFQSVRNVKTPDVLIYLLVYLFVLLVYLRIDLLAHLLHARQTGCKPAVHSESRNWFKFKFLGKQEGRQLLAKVFPFSHFVMTNSSKGEIDTGIAGKCLRRDKNHDSHSRRGSGRGQYTNVDQLKIIIWPITIFARSYLVT